MLMNKEKNFISAVVYVYNQQDKIHDFLQMLNGKLSEYFEKYEIICVNDFSADDSVKEIKRYAASVKGNVISIINMSFYQGLELSMNAGVDLAIGDFVYEFDSPEQLYEPDLIAEIYQNSIGGGYDIVSAAPVNGRRMLSKIFYAVFNKMANTQYLLRTESFRILSRRAINRVYSMSKTIPYRKAVYANCGLKTNVITFQNTEFPAALDKKIFHKQKEIASEAVILYTDIAYRFSSSFSILMMLIAMLIGIYTVCIYLGGRPVAGWTTTMLFLAFAFFGMFAILAIVIKYMSLCLKMLFNKQKYIVEAIEKISN